MKTARQAELPEDLARAASASPTSGRCPFFSAVPDAEMHLGWCRTIAVIERGRQVNAHQGVSLCVVQGNAGVDAHQRRAVRCLRSAALTPLRGAGR